MEGAIYLLCAATALICALLLLRGYRGSGARLLFWCSLCFLALTAENVFLFIDLVVIPHIDLSALHLSAATVAVVVLVYGLVWDVK